MRAIRGIAIGLAAVGAATALVLPCPGIAHADSIVLEGRSNSTARIDSDHVQDATPIRYSDDILLVYGTLAPDERLDACRFDAPRTEDVTIALLVKEGVWLGDTPPTLLVEVAERRSLIVAVALGSRPGQLDLRALERYRRLAELPLSLSVGRSYVVAVRPGTPTGPTLPYVIRVGGAGRGGSDLNARAAWTVPQLWIGAYGQSPLRPLPLLVLVVLALAAIALVAYVAKSAAGVARRVAPRRPEVAVQAGGGLTAAAPAVTGAPRADAASADTPAADAGAGRARAEETGTAGVPPDTEAHEPDGSERAAGGASLIESDVVSPRADKPQPDDVDVTGLSIEDRLGPYVDFDSETHSHDAPDETAERHRSPEDGI